MRQATVPIVLATLFMAGATASAGDIRVTGQFVSETTSGPPLLVNSSDKVSGLNADKLDGFDVGDFATEGSGIGVHYKNIVGMPGIEIDQECAVNTGCFDGDDPGFPVTIKQRGSFRLVGNLETSSEDITLIEILTAGVTLDLSGFQLRGPVACGFSGENLNCSPTGGTGRGIYVYGGLFNIRIRNGAIQGMGERGIYCRSPSSCEIDRISAAYNGSTGFYFRHGTITNSVAHKNDGYGINGSGTIIGNRAQGNRSTGIQPGGGGGAPTIVVDNSSLENGGSGISTSGSGYILRGNSAWKNDIYGIRSGPGSTIESNTSFNNGSHGFVLNPGSSVSNNSAFTNGSNGFYALSSQSPAPVTVLRGNNSSRNGDNGYECLGCLMLDNSGSGNANHGVKVSNYSALGRNLFSENGDVDISGSYNDLGDNTCGFGPC